MNPDWKSCDAREFIWPATGVALGALAAINPFYEPHITLRVGIAAWFISLTLALILSVHPAAARIGAVVTGLFLAVPCFLGESPLSRGLLMCCMALPLAVLALPLSIGTTAGARERLVYFFTWLGTHEAQRRPRSFEAVWLLRVVVATVVLAGAMVCVKAVPPAGLWLVVRWLGGGIMLLAWAEMVTACHEFLTALIGLRAAGLMRSPHLSTSISEFWAERWNPAASVLVFRKYCFAPLARKGVALALVGAFLFSAIAHFLGGYMAIGKWGISAMCGAFFLAQPLLIGAERWMRVRCWRRGARRAWTLAALTATSPLFVEPAVQLFEPSWGPPGYVLLPTIAVLVYVIVVTAFFAIGYRMFGSNKSLHASRRAGQLTSL
ncbi:MAG: hypothetical protein ACXWIU_01800 [Limisphaerales bacterium]